MSPRRRIHDSSAARVAAHRERQAKQGKVRLQLTVSAETAQRLRAEAQARGCALGEALEALLAG
jgi:hypothetical protein